MSEIKKKDKSIELICDCGAIHTISTDEKNELVVNSVYKKAAKKLIEEPIKKESDADGTSEKTIFDYFK
jgi:hypothetical protein